ncbi:pilus assembly protein PilQ [Methylomonas lenta]|uniref:Pilus assembly protein PilQ n=1 Tax=Methylomonas lenta TaxID=980561 RepID=A0A177NQ46_9GAMM|nr:type IV pilus secretin family protein [Methylomonas lenta]OAI20105.1 pilus assembly protein PilQ [Methylomonas lenta]
MSTKQNKMMKTLLSQFTLRWMLIMLFTLPIYSVNAAETSINNLEFSSLAGNQLQIQLDMSGPIAEPKIFQTDNPSRIALDFDGVKSNLAKKSFPINQGAANTVYVVEASGRTRVVINLTEKVPYQTRQDGNKYYIVLKSAGAVAAVNTISQANSGKETALSRFLPEQSIKSIDFRRGPNGEGRLMLGLTTPNTVVDSKQVGGKVILNFLNTTIPDSLIKSFDVADFATPVQKIEAEPLGENVRIAITPSNPNYEYSSYQEDNLLTVEFRPLTPAEKEAQLRERQPYIGSKLSLNFQQIDVKSVLMILADHIKTQEGKEINIVTTDSVGGSIALHVNDVPWDQVLDVVMKLRGLSKRENGNVILIGPTEEIKVLEEKELEARKVQEELEPLKNENIQINYAKAENICAILLGRSVSASMAGSGKSGSGGSTTGGSSGGSGSCGTSSGGSQTSQSGGAGGAGGTQNMRLLSARGSVIADGRTNVLIVKDTATQLEEIHKMIAKLDIPVRQVMIEARVVIASTTFARDLGVRFGVNTVQNNDSDVAGLAQLGYTLAAASPPGALAMTLAAGANYLLSLEIEALQNEGKGEQLSNPRVLTSDRQMAHIEQGSQIPYQSSSANSGPTTEFIDATLMMDVTPQITPTGSIIMDIEVSKDAPGLPVPTGLGGEALAIEKKNVMTRVQVEDGETVVLGGVYESKNFSSRDSVPWFGDVPILGWLFTPLKSVSEDKTELLIFVTPKVVKSSLTTH